MRDNGLGVMSYVSVFYFELAKVFADDGEVGRRLDEFPTNTEFWGRNCGRPLST